MTRKEARKAGLGKAKGLFIGILDGLPIFVPDAVHTLVCAPARTGKTICAVLAMLWHDIGCSRIVADLKGELAVMCAVLIAKLHGHRVIILNPAHKFGLPNASINPLVVIREAISKKPQDVMADSRSLAYCLNPKEPNVSDQFWPNGTRKLLVFVIVGVCALREEFEANLPHAYEVLVDDDEFEKLIRDALESDILAGDLARRARNILSTRGENPKHFESFREAAVQALVSFEPSGHLAPSMVACDFRFSDLKKEKITLFMIADYTRQEAYAEWLAVLIWAALIELVREDNDVPVRFILDEFTNYRLPGLPNALTALAGYGVLVSMIVQDLEEVARVYGREALNTILSQTDVKQIFGIASLQTARMVSEMLGEVDEVNPSYNLADDPFGAISMGLGLGRKPRMSIDQLLRMPSDEQIAFIKNRKAAKMLKIGVHEIDPVRGQVAGNPLHGGKPFLGKVKMRLRGGRAIATRRGRKKNDAERRPLIRPILSAMVPFVPDRSAVLPAALVALVLVQGWPQLRIQYTSNYSWCRYQGIPVLSDPVTLSGDSCPLIIWQK
ncbi:type IV secretory system conjugative DNA transfer family protein [Ruegeria profundi]|uniref:type IV secretory system conjugative DNA transfer family protein n=1 Tax=Ruegeria profundi TaxID=1685378 RepID=UPI0012FD51FF|nr:type IV secretory system conjugative DNA transfer family protein [Ruegeria profundi]